MDFLCTPKVFSRLSASLSTLSIFIFSLGFVSKNDWEIARPKLWSKPILIPIFICTASFQCRNTSVWLVVITLGGLEKINVWKCCAFFVLEITFQSLKDELNFFLYKILTFYWDKLFGRHNILVYVLPRQSYHVTWIGSRCYNIDIVTCKRKWAQLWLKFGQ